MNEHRNNNTDIVDRAADVLNRLPVPQGPPEEVARAVLAAGNGVAIRPTKGSFIMRNMPKIAAAVLVLAVVGGVIGWLTLGHGGATVAWADVQELILAARTMTCRLNIVQPGAPAMEMKMMFKEPGLLRQEITSEGGAVNIINTVQERMVALIPAEKKAIVVDMSGLPAQMREKNRNHNFLEELKKLVRESESYLGEREIDGRLTQGYEVVKDKDKQVFKIWVDAETGLPVEISLDMFGGETEIVMYDFTFDEELDDSLFSQEVPEDYELVEQKMDISPASDEDLVRLFEIWAEARGGTFPDALTPVSLARDMQKAGPPPARDGKTGEEFAMEFGQCFARAIILLQMHPEHVYAGKGVAAGDADTPIFWYKPDGGQTWTVIYGDLQVVTGVAEDDLPELLADEPEAEPAEAPIGLVDPADDVDIFASSTIRVQMIDADGHSKTCGSKVPATVEVQPLDKPDSDEQALFVFSNGSRIPVKLPAKVLVIRHADARTIEEIEVIEPGMAFQVDPVPTDGEPDALKVTTGIYKEATYTTFSATDDKQTYVGVPSGPPQAIQGETESEEQAK